MSHLKPRTKCSVHSRTSYLQSHETTWSSQLHDTQQLCLFTCFSTRTGRLTKAQVRNGVSVCSRVKVSHASQLAFGRLLRRLACSTKSSSWKCFKCKTWKINGKTVYHFLPHEWTPHFVRTASSNIRVLPTALPSTDGQTDTNCSLRGTN